MSSNDEIRATAVHTPGKTGFSIEIVGKLIPLNVRRYSEAETHADHINRVLRLVELRGEVGGIELSQDLNTSRLNVHMQNAVGQLDALEKGPGL